MKWQERDLMTLSANVLKLERRLCVAASVQGHKDIKLKNGA
jgi:hypothetical protein